MFKRVLLAAAVIIASPAIASAQDIVWSFDENSSAGTTSAPVGSVGTAYIFADAAFGFDALDLDFTSSDTNVLQVTGGSTFNEAFSVIGGNSFDSSELTLDPSGAGGKLFAVNVTQNGVNPAVSALFNPGFRAGVGVVLAAVDYSVVGAGDATLSFSLGPQGALQLPLTELNPSFGTASLTGVSTIPEPSSLALLVLGSVGLVTRRRRS